MAGQTAERKPPDGATPDPAGYLFSFDTPYPSGEGRPDKWKVWSGRLKDVAKHPLTLLLVSTALIPLIIYTFNQWRALEELRQKKALEIIEKNSSFEGQLYSLYIDLGLFHQSNRSTKPDRDKLRSLLEGLDARWGARYVEFTKTYSEEGLWANDLYRHAIVLKLLPGESSMNSATLLGEPCTDPSKFTVKIERDIAAYKCNVVESLGVLGDYKLLFNFDTYDYNNPELTNKMSGEFINGRYNDLRARRSVIVDELVKDFSQ